jgi:glycosyltransferase involved in cell wall biosynthesis
VELTQNMDGSALRILVLSFYYEPDLCAGSFRTTPLVAALRARAPAGTQFDVLTTLPNRYHSFAREAAEDESHPGLHIHRIKLPPHRSDMRGQSRAFMHFARAVRAYVAGRDYDLVFATSSRLMTATLGAWIARDKGARLYLDIRDIFVDTINDVLPRGIGRPLSLLLGCVESWTLRRADCINLVSPGFAEYFRARYPDRRLSWFTNGIDPEFVQPVAPRTREPGAPITILYAGNIGEGQGLHCIIPGLAQALRGRARFVVIGDGGRRAQLAAAIEAAGCDNVTLQPPVGRTELRAAYQTADVLFLHLGAQPAFELVLPSKVFEYAALGKPLLAGVGGYAARFITAEVSNSAVFAPEDVAGAIAALDTLTLTDQARPQFVTRYARSNIVMAMADDVLSLAHARQ